MKKEQREAYITLTNEIDWSLCAFCKFSETSGSVCDFAGTECHHPLWQVPGHDEELSPGSDCWGFRPKYDISFIAGIVGVCLENGWDAATWWKREDGEYAIAGVA